MAAVAGVIVIVIVVLLAVVAGGNNAKVATVQEVADGAYEGKKVQVTGTVEDNSYAIGADGALTFRIVDDNDASSAVSLAVSYDKGVSATFGNGVSAICTGRVEDGVLVCSELVTKCPSKYENASGALTVGQLLEYDANTMVGKTVKVVGQASALADATAAVRLVLSDPTSEAAAPATLSVTYGGALPEGIVDGSRVVLTGALSDGEGTFSATSVALGE